MSNPAELYGRPWSEREFIVVLDSYFAHRGQPRHSDCDYIKDVSQLLGRTPGAVSMRMENYASIDPEMKDVRVGLTHINALGRKTFHHWREKREALRECAEVLVRDYKSKNVPTLFESSPVRMPKAFDHYELIDAIGEGGSGVVFSCIEVSSQQLFAIKIIRTDRIHDDEVLHRFRREIRALKAIRHPNIIGLHEDNLDSERNFPAFIMDFATHSLTSYVEDTDRQAVPRMRPILAQQEVVDIINAACEAVAALHLNHPRLIHRDINPNNLLRFDGKWVLADFGLAKFLSTAPLSTSFYTTTGRGFGTMWYTAPEQYRNFADADERADIYSLGILLWELFTTSEPPPDRQHAGLSDRLLPIFLKATDRDPNNRFATVSEFRVSFLAAVEGTTDD